jgi:thiol-disulfide isomerase/thioredoxin
MNLHPSLAPASAASPARRASRGAAVVFLFAAAGVYLVALAPEANAQQPQPKTSAASPIADPAVIDLAGFQSLLAKQRGKPVLVNFWATWCEPCREEYPMVIELARRYAPQGLVVIGISLDEDAEIELVRHFLARNRPGFPNYRKRPGNDEERFINAMNPKWSGAIPATFFYARDGREVAGLVGEHKREEFEKAIRALLGPGAKNADQPRTKTGSSGP